MTDTELKTTGWSRRTKLLIAGGTAALIAVGGVAGVAQAKRGYHHGGHHGGFDAALAERYDGNKDGKITQEEIDTNRTQWHAEFDKDKSGDLAMTEFEQLWLKAKREQMVREFQRFDKDGDGKMTAGEYKGPLASLVADMDRDGDGVLTKQPHHERGMKDMDGMPKEEMPPKQ